DVPGSDAVALDVFAGLDVRVGEDLEPPFAALLRVRLAAMGQVRLADDADDVVVPLDHGHGADAVPHEQGCDLRDRIVGPNSEYVPCHCLARVHGISSKMCANPKCENSCASYLLLAERSVDPRQVGALGALRQPARLRRSGAALLGAS